MSTEQQTGAVVAVMMRAAGVSRRQAADRLGISTSAIGRRLRGEATFTVPELDRIARLVADALLRTSRTGEDDVADRIRPQVQASLSARMVGAAGH